MTRQRRVGIALVFIAVFAAALRWLPVTAALVVGAVLALGGVAPFRKPAWRTGAPVLTSVLLGLAALNTAFWLISPHAANAGVVKTATPAQWIGDDPVIGYTLRANTSVDIMARLGDQVVYHQNYTIEPSGARATPGSGPDGPT